MNGPQRDVTVCGQPRLYNRPPGPLAFYASSPRPRPARWARAPMRRGGGGRCTAHVTSLGSCQTQTSTTSSTLNPDQLAGSTAARTEREEALALTAAEYSAMKRRGQLPSAGKGRRCSGEGEGGVGVAGSPGPASRQRYKPSVDVTLP